METPLILALSNPTASGAGEWDYSFSSDLWSLWQPPKYVCEEQKNSKYLLKAVATVYLPIPLRFCLIFLQDFLCP